MIVLVGLLTAVAANAGSTTPKPPSEAIALADAHSERGNTGTFQMRVAAAERHPNALYLNSSTDYRSPDDVTFQLTLSAARTLEKRIGGKPETALLGNLVTVQGQIRRVPIVNLVAGRPRSLNRYQHTVLVRDASKVTIE